MIRENLLKIESIFFRISIYFSCEQTSLWKLQKPITLSVSLLLNIKAALCFIPSKVITSENLDVILSMLRCQFPLSPEWEKNNCLHCCWDKNIFVIINIRVNLILYITSLLTFPISLLFGIVLIVPFFGSVNH